MSIAFMTRGPAALSSSRACEAMQASHASGYGDQQRPEWHWTRARECCNNMTNILLCLPARRSVQMVVSPMARRSA